MRIAEILFWNNGSAEGHPSELQLGSPPVPFSGDLTNLANAFTKDGLVKHLWNPSASEEQPSGPAPPEAGTDLIPSGTLEPSAASWEPEPVETERPVGLYRPVPFSAMAQSVSLRPGNRGISQRRHRRCERRHEVSGRPFETIGCPSCSSATTMM